VSENRREIKKPQKTVIASSANAQDSVQDADDSAMNSEREGEEEEEEGEAEEQRRRREKTRGKEDEELPLSLPSGHRPADDPRCVRRTFPGTHGRASLPSPAVPGDAVGRTD
jgi:hypothetical protein